MPEHLDARTAISRDMFYCISADQNFRVKKDKNKNLPSDHKISEKKDANQLFFYLALG